jgi:protein gp37
MGADTKIEWADHTFNPWWGCAKVSPGCEHCYAEGVANRFAPGLWGPNASRRFFGDKHWAEPLKWNRAAERDGVRRRVFCGSMCDVFEWLPPNHPDGIRMAATRGDLRLLVEQTLWLDWLLLTKRPENTSRIDRGALWSADEWPSNVWLGVTAEDQRRADERIPVLLETPAAVRFVSVEPMLETVDLLRVEWPDKGGHRVDVLRCGYWSERWGFVNHSDMPGPLSWVIVGAESGPKRRPMPHDWARSLRDQCIEAGVPYFLKQLSANEDGTGPLVKMPELDGKVWREMPGQ